MKKYRDLILGTTLVLFVACARSGIEERLQRSEQERAKLQAELENLNAEKEVDQQHVIATTTVLNEIQDSLAQVRREELQVLRITLGPEFREGIRAGNQREALLADVEAIRRALTTNRDKLRELNQQSRKSASQIVLLNSVVERLQATIDEQQHELDQMANVIRGLREELAVKDQTIQLQSGTIQEQATTIQQQQENFRKGYALIGTSEELQKVGVIEPGRGGFLNLRRQWRLRPEIDFSAFDTIDTENQKEISLPASLTGITLLSQHPADSYRLESQGRNQSVLHIEQPNKFWQMRFVVILVRSWRENRSLREGDS